MSINHFFEETLHAKPKNQRWSWGAFDPASNRVFLRIWKDQIRQDADGEKVVVYWKNAPRNSAGYAERRKHIEAIKNGAQGIGVVCKPLDPRARLRQIITFERSPLLEFGALSEDDTTIYAEIRKRVSRSMNYFEVD